MLCFQKRLRLADERRQLRRQRGLQLNGLAGGRVRNGRGLIARWRVGLPKLKGRIREGDEAAFRGGG